MSEAVAEAQAKVEPPARDYLPVSPEEQAQWVKRFLESGFSIRKFARVNDIPRMSLWRWVQRAGEGRPGSTGPGYGSSEAATEPAVRPKSEPGVAQFAELKLPPSFGQPMWAVEVALPNGTVLRLTKDTPPTLVDQLLRIC